MDYQKIGIWLFEFIHSIVKIFHEVWNALNTTYSFGEIKILGWTISQGVTITPLGLTAGVVVAIVVVSIASLFIP